MSVVPVQDGALAIDANVIKIVSAQVNRYFLENEKIGLSCQNRS